MVDWVAGQKYYASQSNRNELVKALGGHYIYLEYPDVVYGYIKKILIKIKNIVDK